MDDCSPATTSPFISAAFDLIKTVLGVIIGYWIATRGEKRKCINSLIGTLVLMQDELRILDESGIEDFHQRCVGQLRTRICDVLPEFQESATAALTSTWRELSEFKEHLFISELESSAQFSADMDRLKGKAPALTKRQALDRLLNDTKSAAHSLRSSSIGDF